MAVTSFEQFKAMAFKEVELPGFEEGQKVVVRLRKVSILGLASSGKIPNTLMGAVNKLFGEGQKGTTAEEVASKSVENLAEMAKLLDLIAENALVEPKYSEVGEFLTDDQKNAIFEYSQSGVKKVEPFPNK